MSVVRIPRAFYDDHAERELPTPEPVRETTRHVWIRRDDPAYAELLNDARYYADPDGPDHPSAAPYRRAAVAMLRAIGEPTP